MIEAYIFDAIRTPRGIGKKTGSLHQLAPIKLASKTLKKLEERKTIVDHWGRFSLREIHDQ